MDPTNYNTQSSTARGGVSPCRALQTYSRNSDALTALSSLASFDSTERSARANCESSKSALVLNLENLGSQPLPMGLFAEKDGNVRQTLSQDWLRTTYSPRAGAHTPRGSFGGRDGRDRHVNGSRQSLQSIPEDDNDGGSDASMEELEDEMESLSLSTHRQCSETQGGEVTNMQI